MKPEARDDGVEQLLLRRMIPERRNPAGTAAKGVVVLAILVGVERAYLGSGGISPIASSGASIAQQQEEESHHRIDDVSPASATRRRLSFASHATSMGVPAGGAAVEHRRGHARARARCAAGHAVGIASSADSVSGRG